MYFLFYFQLLEDHQIIVTANPYLTNSYYFNKNELIVFKLRIAYNGSTGAQYTNIKIRIQSEWIDLTKGSVVKDQFDNAYLEGSTAVYETAALQQNAVLIGNISGAVKPNIGPLARLELKITLNATQGVDNVHNDEFISSPTLFGVFPDVNVTGVPEGSMFFIV